MTDSIAAESRPAPSPPGRRGYSVRRQFIWVSLGRVAAALIQAATIVMVARQATPSEFGAFSAAYGVVIVGQALTGLGLSTFITQERSRSIDSPLIRGALRLNGSISLLALVVGVLACLALAPISDGFSLLFAPYIVWGLTERNAAAWTAIAFADGDAWLNMSNLVGRRLLTLAGFMVAIALGIGPVAAFGIAAASAGVCSLVFARVYVRRRLSGGRSRDYRTIIRAAMPFWFNLIAGQLRNLDTLLVGIAVGAAQAGLYGAGARIMGPLRILPDALASALLPAASRDTFKPSMKLLRQFGLFSAAATALGLVGVMIVPYVVEPVLGSQYSGAEGVIQLTVLGLPFASLVAIQASMLQGLGMKSFVAGLAFAATATCLCGVSIGAVLGGAVGAMLGYTVALLLHAIAISTKSWIVVRRIHSGRAPAIATPGDAAPRMARFDV